jgi:hypothetical protein
MAIVLKVLWVEQSENVDPYQRVGHIGGQTGELKWKHSFEEAIKSIEEGLFIYFVEKGSKALKLEVVTSPNGHKYLQTEADTGQPASPIPQGNLK